MNAGDLTDPSTRVALLARPGLACERLHAALQQAGADIVLVADPADSDAAGVRAAGAQAILIALEPQVDAALDRYDALLADPDITVIFDEADLAAQREGWDAARWSRHLAAKLHRHEQVLPPGMEAETPELASEPLMIYQRPESDGDMSAFVVEMDALSFDIPRDGLLEPRPEPAFNPYDPTLAEIGLQSDPAMQPGAAFDLSLLDDGSLDVASAPEFALNKGPRHELSLEDVRPDGDAIDSTDVMHEFEDLLEIPNSAPEGFAQVGDTFVRDMEQLRQRATTLELDDATAQPASQDGAVVVIAGIGGPDSVRQLLGGLPPTFPRPVLIQQHLEGGQHDKLVRQMQRASPMPVHLAEVGQLLERGHVYILPVGLGIGVGDDGLRFQAGDADLLVTLPASDSGIVLLSGAASTLVDSVLSKGFQGALVAGQLPESCFDGTAAAALIARGGDSGTPVQLATKLMKRWLSLKD